MATGRDGANQFRTDFVTKTRSRCNSGRNEIIFMAQVGLLKKLLQQMREEAKEQGMAYNVDRMQGSKYAPIVILEYIGRPIGPLGRAQCFELDARCRLKI